MDNNELLQAISNMLDTKLDEKLKPVNDRLDKIENDIQSLKNDIREIKVVQLENNIIPRLQNIESCTSNYKKV